MNRRPEAQCSKCGGAGTIWNPAHCMGWPRSISCPKCDGWNKTKAAEASAAQNVT